MENKIKCNVSSCTHNVNCNCDAKSVEVNCNCCNCANSSEQTLCKTFVKKINE